jgi:hypothetical protein
MSATIASNGIAPGNEIGGLLFSAQYQQRPAPMEGNLIRRAWLLPYEPAELPAPVYPSKVVQSWDVAMMTGDTTRRSRCSWRKALTPTTTIQCARLGSPTRATSIFSTCFAVGSNIPICAAESLRSPNFANRPRSWSKTQDRE